MAHGIVIPDDVKHALAEDRLVFFCGAGISRYTGLPDFKGLTKETFKACGASLAEDKDSALEPWDFSFHAGQYDRALFLLEQRSTNMRSKVMEILSKRLPRKLKGNPYLHQNILNLANLPSGGHRLITTNFDDRFTRAGLKPHLVHDAPRLTPLRYGEWHHATYLHGRIDKKADPDGQHLVLTSSDFGNGYLRDGWATRFVVELFREFTVLFIGYGVNDPVMTYLIDAIAIDAGENQRFRRPYAIAGYDGSDPVDKKRQIDMWESKGITLIPFDTNLFPDDRYKPLFDHLEEWANQRRRGLDGRIQDALRATRNQYLPLPESNLSHIAWTLLDPTVARAFAEADPSPDISWLKPLSDVVLYPYGKNSTPLKLFELPAGGVNALKEDWPVMTSSLVGAAAFSGLRLHRVTQHLACWLIKNLEKQEELYPKVGDGLR